MNRKVLFHLLFALALVVQGACTRQTPPAEAPGDLAQTGADEMDPAVDDSVDMVLRVRQTSRLYTAEYQVHKIITHADVKHLKATLLGHEYDTRLSLGDRKVAIPIDVTLQAYIDFSTFHETQIRRSADGRHLHIILPDPKVVVVASKVDHESVRQFTDLLRSDFSDEELADFTAQGVRSILRQVPELGILHTARDNAAAILIPMFAALGYEQENILITFRKEFTEQDLPFYTTDSPPRDSPPALPVREGANTFKK